LRMRRSAGQPEFRLCAYQCFPRRDPHAPRPAAESSGQVLEKTGAPDRTRTCILEPRAARSGIWAASSPMRGTNSAPSRSIPLTLSQAQGCASHPSIRRFDLSQRLSQGLPQRRRGRTDDSNQTRGASDMPEPVKH
jgi:hypothetical protein